MKILKFANITFARMKLTLNLNLNKNFIIFLKLQFIRFLYFICKIALYFLKNLETTYSYNIDYYIKELN